MGGLGGWVGEGGVVVVVVVVRTWVVNGRSLSTNRRRHNPWDATTSTKWQLPNMRESRGTHAQNGKTSSNSDLTWTDLHN